MCKVFSTHLAHREYSSNVFCVLIAVLSLCVYMWFFVKVSEGGVLEGENFDLGCFETQQHTA